MRPNKNYSKNCVVYLYQVLIKRVMACVKHQRQNGAGETKRVNRILFENTLTVSVVRD